MDKNMINIDDLFRQRLSGGEENERPGAWLQMRDLLDQKMPAKPVAGASRNWRRMLGVLAGVAAISLMGLGGYQMVTGFRGDGNGTEDTGTANKGSNAAISARGVTGDMKRAEDASSAITNNNDNGPVVAANTKANKAGSSLSTATGMANANGTGNTGSHSALNNNINNNNTTANHNNRNSSHNRKSATRPVNTAIVTAGTTTNNGNMNPAAGSAPNQLGRSAANDIAAQSDRVEGQRSAEATNEQASLAKMSPASSGMASTTSGMATTMNHVPAPAANGQDQSDIAKNSSMDAFGTSEEGNSIDAHSGKAGNNKAAEANADKLIPASNLATTVNTGNVSGKTATLPNSTASKSGTAGNSKATNNQTAQKPGAGSGKVATTGSKALPTANNSAMASSTAGSAKNSTAKPLAGDKGNGFELKKEYIKKIEIRETYASNGKLRIDTVSMGLIEIEKYVRASQQPAADNVALASNATAGMSKKDEIVPMAKGKGSGSGRKAWEPRKLEEMVQNAKLGISSIRFYPGIIAGANTTFGDKNTMAGFQLGASGTLSLNDRWAIFSEAKYVHRFSGGSAIRENYEFESQPSRIVSGATQYTYMPVTKTFSFASVSALEVPVALRYTINRIHLFMGASYSRYFTINAAMNEERGSPYTAATPPTAGADRLNLDVEDFEARGGFGYLFGAAYQVTPAIHVDMRMTQPLWDNMNRKDTKYISDKIFKVPTIQVNFNYRFIRDRKVR